MAPSSTAYWSYRQIVAPTLSFMMHLTSIPAANGSDTVVPAGFNAELGIFSASEACLAVIVPYPLIVQITGIDLFSFVQSPLLSGMNFGLSPFHTANRSNSTYTE